MTGDIKPILRHHWVDSWKYWVAPFISTVPFYA